MASGAWEGVQHVPHTGQRGRAYSMRCIRALEGCAGRRARGRGQGGGRGAHTGGVRMTAQRRTHTVHSTHSSEHPSIRDLPG